MAAGDSVTSLCNRALSHLGERPIGAIGENTKAGLLCALHYGPVRQAELRRYPWNCAQGRAAIPASATPPLFGYANAFPLPQDFLRFWNTDDDNNEAWTIEGGQILTDLGAPLNIIYIRDLADVTVMDALLTAVLANELAIVLCAPMNQSSAKYTELQNKLMAIRPEAQLVDSQENSPKEWDEDVWLRART